MKTESGFVWPLLGATALLGLTVPLVIWHPSSPKTATSGTACARLALVEYALAPPRRDVARAPGWAQVEDALEKTDRGLRNIALESGPATSADSQYVMLLSATAQAASSRMVLLLERFARPPVGDDKVTLEASMALEDARARRSLQALEGAAPEQTTNLASVRASYAQLIAGRMQVQRWSRESDAPKRQAFGGGDEPRCREALEALDKTLQEESPHHAIVVPR